MANLNLTHSGNMNINSASINSQGQIEVDYAPNTTGKVTGWTTNPEGIDGTYEPGESLTVRFTPQFSGTVLTETFTVSGVDVAGVQRSDSATLRQDYNKDLRTYDIYISDYEGVVNSSSVTENYAEFNITMPSVTAQTYVNLIVGINGESSSKHWGAYVVPPTPGPDTGSTTASTLNIVVADSITGTGRASATYTPSNAVVSLRYSSNSPAYATIDPITGEITVLQTGDVRFTVTDEITGLFDSKVVHCYKDGDEPGPDTGDTGYTPVYITELHLVVDDYVTTGDRASATYSPSYAEVDLHYSSSIPEILGIDEYTGEITVNGSGNIQICVTDNNSGLSDCKFVNVESSGFLYVTYDATSTTEPTQIMAHTGSLYTYGIMGAYYNGNEINLASGYTFPSLGEHTIAYKVKNVGPFYCGERGGVTIEGNPADIQTYRTWEGLDSVVKVAYDGDMKYAGYEPFRNCNNLKYVTLQGENPLRIMYYHNSNSQDRYVPATPWTLSDSNNLAIPIVINSAYAQNYVMDVDYVDPRTGHLIPNYNGGVSKIESAKGWPTEMYGQLYPSTADYLLSSGSDQLFITSIEASVPGLVVTGDKIEVTTTPARDNCNRGFWGEATKMPYLSFKDSNRLKEKYEYSSSNQSIAVVSDDGVVAVVGTGSTYFCVYEEYSNLSSCKSSYVSNDELVEVIYDVTDIFNPTLLFSTHSQCGYFSDFAEYYVVDGQFYDESDKYHTFTQTGEHSIYVKFKEFTGNCLGNSIFVGNTNIRKIIFPDNYSIHCTGNNTFSGCSITDAVMRGFTQLNYGAFRGCANLTGLTFDNIEIIGEESLTGTGFVDIYGPKVKTIFNYGLSLTKQLKTVDFPLLEVLTDACFSASTIQEITIPATVTDFSLRGASSMRNITFEGTTPPQNVGQYSWNNCTAMNIWVPCEAVETYRNWVPSSFKPHIRCEEYNSGVIKAVYDLSNTNQLVTNSISNDGGWGSIYIARVGATGGTTSIVKICDSTGKEIGFTAPDGVVGNYTVYITIDIDAANNYGLGPMFAGTELISVLLPEGINHIGTCMFTDCPGLKDITIPSTVTKIGKLAFYCRSNASNLEAIYSKNTTQPTLEICTNTNSSNLTLTPFYYVKTNGKLYYPQGSNYSTWLSTSTSKPYSYLGYYGWTGSPTL